MDFIFSDFSHVGEKTIFYAHYNAFFQGTLAAEHVIAYIRFLGKTTQRAHKMKEFIWRVPHNFDASLRVL